MKVGDFAKECLDEEALVWLEDGKEPLDPEKTLTEAGVVARQFLSKFALAAIR